ncbi:MAG: hypothetical protein RLZZ59_612 [Pseudomonadota bacterium]|jgi:hypothetical protein
MSKEDPQISDEQKVVNEQLVAALATGNKEVFESLLKSGADITALNGDMSKYAHPNKHFNMSNPLKEDARERFNEMVNDLYAGKYTKDIKDINFPGLAAYGGNVELMDKLIQEQPTAGRDFNQSLGARPAHPVLHAVTNGGPEVANKLLDNPKALGINLSKTRTGISDLYLTGKMTQVKEYLTKIPNLSEGDLEDLSKSVTPVLMTASKKNGEERKEFEEVTQTILERIAESMSNKKLLESIVTQVEGFSSPGDAVFNLRDIQLVQKAISRAFDVNSTNPFVKGTSEKNVEFTPMLEKLGGIAGSIRASPDTLKQARAIGADISGYITPGSEVNGSSIAPGRKTQIDKSPKSRGN